ncbi:PepSY-associated TM helix domain-containing protein [Sandaracinus amylolyticus]|uniref:Putative iron-regulated membrane protein n=1 Tax=Sandaracinus amylolyticus TaxID=927083 RepID=A0A0F6SHJ0_9BACT|nr:PepSY-associated TM helix domain-containing protein [Sandaracinus amylolyticus]AKF10529.1 putative iron-regulated membrane protein [Sandaracinus amylolyticus]
MSEPSASGPSTRRRLFEVHTWSGLLVGLLGFVVIGSGAIVVFADDIDVWAHRDRPHPELHDVDALGLERAIARVATTVPPEHLEDIGLWTAHGSVVAWMHHHTTDASGAPIERGTVVHLDPASWGERARRSGTVDEVFAPSPREALSRFFVDLHIRLFLPDTTGLWATGLVGFGLLLLVVTGLFVHRPFFRHATRVRGTAAPRKLLHDLHTVVAVWTLPFTAVLSLTGAFLSFGGALVFPLLTEAAFGGDEAALDRAFSGAPEPAAEIAIAPATTALGAALTDARSRSEHDARRVEWIEVAHWSRSDAHMTLYTSPVFGPQYDVSHRYDGDGTWRSVRACFGNGQSFGGALYQWMSALHYGNFGGGLVRALWMLLGVLAASLALTGLGIWSVRRTGGAEARAGRVAGVLTIGAGLGLPLGAAVAVHAWALANASGASPYAAMAVSLVLGPAIVVWHAARRSFRSVLRLGLVALGVACVLAPLTALVAVGDAFGAAWWIDVTFAVTGIAAIAAGARIGRAVAPDVVRRVAVSGPSAREA